MAELASPFLYCPGCGRLGGSWIRNHEFRCPQCGFRYFHSVATAVGALIVHEGNVLFIERGMEPSKGKLGLPGGFVDPGERAEESLVREIREEVGGEVGLPQLVGSFPNRYTFGATWYNTCDFYFQVDLITPPAELVIDPVEVTRLVWLHPSRVREEDLAFPSLVAFWRFTRDRLSLPTKAT